MSSDVVNTDGDIIQTLSKLKTVPGYLNTIHLGYNMPYTSYICYPERRKMLFNHCTLQTILNIKYTY